MAARPLAPPRGPPGETAHSRLMLSALRVILQYLRPYRSQVWLLLVGLLIDLAWAVLFGMSFQYIVDEAIGKNDEPLLWTVLIGLAAAAVIAGMAAIGRDYLYARLGTSVMNDLRLRMFEHLQRLSASFYSKVQVGDIMSRFSTDLAAVQNAVILAIPETILGTLGLLTISTLLFIFSWQLALLTVLGLPLALIGPRFLGPRAERDSYLVRHEEAKIASAVQENISGAASTSSACASTCSPTWSSAPPTSRSCCCRSPCSASAPSSASARS
jgi:ATP-binding cassette subfamily B protein